MHPDTHLKDHLKDHLKGLRLQVINPTPHPTCLSSSKIRSVTFLLDHPPSNLASLGLGSAANTLPQHRPTGLHRSISSPEASRTNRKHHNNQ